MSTVIKKVKITKSKNKDIKDFKIKHLKIRLLDSEKDKDYINSCFGWGRYEAFSKRGII